MQNKMIIGKLAAVALLATLSAGCATKGYVNEQVALGGATGGKRCQQRDRCEFADDHLVLHNMPL